VLVPSLITIRRAAFNLLRASISPLETEFTARCSSLPSPQCLVASTRLARSLTRLHFPTTAA